MRSIGLRNAMWLKVHMDIYILRWGVLWAFFVMLAILAAEANIPDLLYAVVLAASLFRVPGFECHAVHLLPRP